MIIRTLFNNNICEFRISDPVDDPLDIAIYGSNGQWTHMATLNALAAYSCMASEDVILEDVGQVQKLLIVKTQGTDDVVIDYFSVEVSQSTVTYSGVTDNLDSDGIGKW